ncbi:hypothetical protein MTR_8g011750 [Medicago truncatula]|uniref:Uncharacterized protein n=1 Tax=Medicago truncatula TaxID=3880 RepID=G7LEE9_MEDTR|nr:hypothetical protein MTR_8g011750 [Medicago truncatula]
MRWRIITETVKQLRRNPQGRLSNSHGRLITSPNVILRRTQKVSSSKAIHADCYESKREQEQPRLLGGEDMYVNLELALTNQFSALLTIAKVCSWYQSLVDDQRKRKRTRRFTEWVFTALGRVLYFLNTKKVKDMNEDREANVKKLRKNVELIERDLATARKELIEAEKGFVERDLDAKLGYGAP